jgi:predicted nucleic acid-binding protein
MQTENLRQGLNKVGIPDLIIAQNAIDHDVELFAQMVDKTDYSSVTLPQLHNFTAV